MNQRSAVPIAMEVPKTKLILEYKPEKYCTRQKNLLLIRSFFISHSGKKISEDQLNSVGTSRKNVIFQVPRLQSALGYTEARTLLITKSSVLQNYRKLF